MRASMVGAPVQAIAQGEVQFAAARATSAFADWPAQTGSKESAARWKPNVSKNAASAEQRRRRVVFIAAKVDPRIRGLRRA